MSKLIKPKNVLNKLLELCKRTGYLFPSSEIHGGLRGTYDYGPLGVELKRNLSNYWWQKMVYQQPEKIIGIDTSIINPSSVFKASGHLDNFCDELIDCKLDKTRFRTDKAPEVKISKWQGRNVLKILAKNQLMANNWINEIQKFGYGLENVEYKIENNQILLFVKELILPNKSNNKIGKIIFNNNNNNNIEYPYFGYVSPTTNSPFLTEPRMFNLMFKTFLDPIDPVERVIDNCINNNNNNNQDNNLNDLKLKVKEEIEPSTVYLRPETAQGVFVNYLYTTRYIGNKLPYGVAQIGKSFRNELRVEHMVFRTVEFEQMELEFYINPKESEHWFNYWVEQRFNWWKEKVNQPETFRLRIHSSDELAHYSKACYDIEYQFPWGWGEIEGIANRSDYDLTQHSKTSGRSLSFIDNETTFTPYVIESSAGLNRAFLAFLLDAYTIEPTTQRIILKLHPSLAPIKVCILPLIDDPKLNFIAKQLYELFKIENLNVKLFDQQLKIGKRYLRMDEIGTPFCITIDFDTLKDKMVTIRFRDTAEQIRIHLDEVIDYVIQLLNDKKVKRKIILPDLNEN